MCSVPARRILREAAKPYITPEVYGRIKHPFLAPPTFLNPASKLHDLVQSTLRSKDLERLWWIEPKKVVAQLDELTALVRASNTETMSPQERDEYYSKLLAADFQFVSILSYAMLEKIFRVK